MLWLSRRAELDTRPQRGKRTKPLKIRHMIHAKWLVVTRLKLSSFKTTMELNVIKHTAILAWKVYIDWCSSSPPFLHLTDIHIYQARYSTGPSGHRTTDNVDLSEWVSQNEYITSPLSTIPNFPLPPSHRKAKDEKWLTRRIPVPLAFPHSFLVPIHECGSSLESV